MIKLELINKKYIEDYIQNLIIEEDESLAKFRFECEEKKIPIIHKEIAQLIKFLIKLTNTKRILEFGTAVGYSSIYMSFTINDKNGYITTLERRKSYIEEAEQNILKFKPPTPIQILEGDALEIIDGITNEYDLIFLDAAKSKYMDFFNKSIKLLKPGGIIISDNVLYKGMIANDELVVRRQKTIVNKMRKYLKYISEDSSFETSVLPIGDGLAITLKKESINV